MFLVLIKRTTFGGPDVQPVAHAKLALAAVLTFAGFTLSAAVWSQPPGGPGGPSGARPDSRPQVAVELPALSAEITGPGPIFDSIPSQAPGLAPEDFDFQMREYFVSGTADGRPYTTRIVVRSPAENQPFTGLVVVESMHSSGSAHGFEFNAAYIMDAGHAAVEILTTSPAQFVELNADRYRDLRVEDGQTNEILAQVGALLKSEQAPLRSPARKTVLWGTSMTAATLINYLPDHRVYRTPDMGPIFDGFMPTSTGTTVMETEVPLIQVPTMHEVENNVPRRQDSDEPGSQYRLYEFAGMGHLDSRDNVRLLPNPCDRPLSTYPLQAYMAVALHHMLRWVDEGIAPPRADRILIDRNLDDGSMAALDEHGNPIGGVRSPYLDVPVARYVPVNVPANPPIESPSAWVQANAPMGAQIMCRLSSYQEPLSPPKLREIYGSRQSYLRQFEARLDELEREGWSLPVYRDMILADAAGVRF
jgi:hypothetical protein